MELVQFLLFSFFLVILWQEKSVTCDYFTSVEGLDDLIHAEKHYIDSLENYLLSARQENENLLQFLDDVEDEIALIQDHAEYFFENPLYAFGVLRRVTFDWQELRDGVLSNNAGEVYAKNISILSKRKFKQPQEDDLQGAVKGLARLQGTYALPTVDVANGILNGRKLSQRLSYTDCFQMGSVLRNLNQSALALEWLVESKLRQEEHLSKTGNNYDFPFVLREQMLEELAQTVAHLGNYKMALSFINHLLALESNNEVGLKSKPIFEQKVHEERNASRKNETTKFEKKTEVQILGEKVCRGELQQSPAIKSKLFCYYDHKQVPFCRIAPFKTEQLSKDPLIAVYHDVIYDSEIYKIKNATAKKIERSRHSINGVSQYTDTRNSKNSWLSLKTEKFLKNLAQRLTDITGLSLETGEMMQVANYGIGGQYDAHCDFGEGRKFNNFKYGHRILTALFYINTVEMGGATAFPFLHLAVPPKRRSLLVWYNLHESLEPDHRSRHMGCPVLKGSKWICNEWYHERAQEFLRPCSLHLQGHKSLPYSLIQ